MPTTWSSPPPYASVGPSRETTPLIHRREERKSSRVVPALIIVLILLVILTTIFLSLWVPNIQSAERKKWKRELAQHRLAEQSRIEIWEKKWMARKYEEKVRQDEWDRNQTEIRREETQRREQERLREDQWQREEEGRQSLGLYWDIPVADTHCTAHNTREYWARLLNTVPYNYNWLKPCQDIPIVIHGRSINTTRCYVNPHVPGEVYGHWLVDFNEPLCSPYWDQFKDKGCTAEGSGRRRIESHLENIRDGEDGEKLCSSAPHDFYGQHFDYPDSCANWGGYIFGIWEINDPNC